MKNADEPAFPRGVHKGLTKREYCAIEAMKGLISNPEIADNISSLAQSKEGLTEEEAFKKVAFDIADAMLKESDNEQE